MVRFFNTAGPCEAGRHYLVPPLPRIAEVRAPIERDQYFVLHAPRQSGKTTAMLALAAELRAAGHVALLASIESARVTADADAAELVVIDSILESGRALDPSSAPPPRGVVDGVAPRQRLRSWLRRWSEAVAPRRVVLLLDEVDSLQPEALYSLLAQLRAGFPERSAGRFPASVALIGLRDLRDYLLEVTGGAAPGPGSPFNVKVESFSVADFTRDEVVGLYAQHTADTGQVFAEAAVDRAMYWSRGQPYLVNALAGRCVDHLVPDRTVAVAAAHVDAAAEHLIRRRVTHLDNLAMRLREPRVARVVQSVLLGESSGEVDSGSDDFQYVLDLGLLARGPAGPEPANPMYREVLVRQLSVAIQDSVSAPWWPWRRPDGTLDFPRLVDAFRTWWRRHADTLATNWSEGYPEVVPQLVFMGFLQRVVNGGGTVEREFAAGRGRIDLVVQYGGARSVVELKRVPPRKVSLATITEEGVEQLAGYLDQLGEAEGWLVVFDQRPNLSWDERMWTRDVEIRGKIVHLVGG